MLTVERHTERLELHGAAVSAGKSIGPARIVRTPADLTRIRRGDIVVSRMAMNGLPAYVPDIGGVVLEIGGQLSTFGILAREFRVPAVFGVMSATTRLRDGQTVRIDGARGVITT